MLASVRICGYDIPLGKFFLAVWHVVLIGDVLSERAGNVPPSREADKVAK